MTSGPGARGRSTTASTASSCRRHPRLVARADPLDPRPSRGGGGDGAGRPSQGGRRDGRGRCSPPPPSGSTRRSCDGGRQLPRSRRGRALLPRHDAAARGRGLAAAPTTAVLVVAGGDGRPRRPAGRWAAACHDLEPRRADGRRGPTPRSTGASRTPSAWASPTTSFDVCVVHQGLHHCRSPHRGLLEMYRVARRGLVMFEPQDTVLTRLGVRLGVGQRYELAAVADNDLRWGGVQNTDVPNFVYRWTEREVRKTLGLVRPDRRSDGAGVPRPAGAGRGDGGDPGTGRSAAGPGRGAGGRAPSSGQPRARRMLWRWSSTRSTRAACIRG